MSTATADHQDLGADQVNKREPLATNWCFTQHFADRAIEEDAEKDAFAYFTNSFKMLDNINLFKWCIFELEHGKEGGRPHIQGFFKLNQRKRMSDLLRTWPRPGALLKPPHLEAANGDDKSQWDYCGKEQQWTGDFFVEWGTRPVFQTNGERERTRWATARQAAQTAQLDSVPDDIFVMYYGNLSKIAANYKRAKIMDCSRGELPQHFKWIYGPPGSGKTTFVHDKVARENASLYLKDCLTKWWDGFHGQEYTLLDDFPREGAEHMLNRFKQWCQQFPFPGETKGGLQQMRPENIYVTSNYHPREIWGSAEERDMEAFEQRFEIVYLGPAGQEWKPRATAVGFVTPISSKPAERLWAPKKAEVSDQDVALKWFEEEVHPGWPDSENVGSDEIAMAHEFYKSGQHMRLIEDKRFYDAFIKTMKGRREFGNVSTEKLRRLLQDPNEPPPSPIMVASETPATQPIVTESQLQDDEEEE